MSTKPDIPGSTLDSAKVSVLETPAEKGGPREGGHGEHYDKSGDKHSLREAGMHLQTEKLAEAHRTSDVASSRAGATARPKQSRVFELGLPGGGPQPLFSLALRDRGSTRSVDGNIHFSCSLPVRSVEKEKERHKDGSHVGDV